MLFSNFLFLFQRAEGDLSQRGETSHFSDPKSIETCKDPVTILLLGTADSGKSTVVKQMKVHS
jgi:polynucleotide 5'-kinase involved in rRNA processing